MTPLWMGVVLLAATVLGILLLLVGGWSLFVDTSSGSGSGDPGTSSRFIDRAMMVVGQSQTGSAAWASVAALTAFMVVALSRRQQHLRMPSWFWLSGMVVTGLLSAVELAGPVLMAIGLLQLARDPTAARDAVGQLLIVGPPLALSLVLALLSFLIAWVLWHARPAPREALPQRRPRTTTEGPAGGDGRDVYRRPPQN